MSGTTTKPAPVEVLSPEPPPPQSPARAPVKLPFVRRLTRPLLWHPLRWYAYRELPHYGHFLHWWGVNIEHEWLDAPTRIVRSRFHGHKLRLDLSDFFQRLTYFLGCWPEAPVVWILKHALRPGDAFVDGGANIGMLTLEAAGWVGPQGRVDAFEPFDRVFQWLDWHVRENGLSQVRTHRLGLSDEAESLVVRLPGEGNLGAGTLGPLPDRYNGYVTASGNAATVRGDDILDPSDTRPLLIKLDIEGFETRAVRGLMGTLRRRLPALVVEINNENLATNGTSALELHSILTPLGYSPWAIDHGGFRSGHRLWLHPLRPEQIWLDHDVLWLHPDGPHWERLCACMQPPGKYWLHMEYARRMRVAAAQAKA